MPHLNERQLRLAAALEARSLGYGGVSAVAQATGIARGTIHRALEEIKDPPLAFVTVTDTKVTGDLHDATVFYTVRGKTLDEEPDYAGAAAALERAKGTLRSKVGAGTGVRFTPTLAFVLDKVPDTAAQAEWVERFTRNRGT